MGEPLIRLNSLADRILSSFKSRDQRKLRKLNDEVLKVSYLEFNRVTFNLGTYSYVLSKIVSKPRFLSPEFESSLNAIEKTLEKLVNRIDQAQEEEVLNIFSELERAVAHLEDRDPRFVVDLVTKGRLKMAATFYAQGMSLGVAADMTGLDKQEILDYAGETMMFDRLKDEMKIGDRMKVARKLVSQ
ncbi:Uncharacterised protein [Candidatus Bilamarchaeum dharawalense]|uniref:Uncharacterized protein n=1 Tax=Candidatus Bilamarchaeum dharawalense TaxID=2885759 RepID=A0A5E4LTM0_9ARCH|nr:Uncharacterised protein [Candidatus Bilamarchaeum dharawalense]